MDIINGQTQFQDTHFVIGDFEIGPYRALRKLDAQVAEISRTLPAEGSAGYREGTLRLENYAALRERILASRPESYWAAGFEAAEEEYWVNTLSRKVALETATTGRPALPTMEAVMSLPEDARNQVLRGAAAGVSMLRVLGVDKLYLGVNTGE